MKRLFPVPLIASLVVSLSPRPGLAQAPECTYDRCALRVENPNPVLPARVVQGVEARPVGTVGLFSGSIPLLANGPDSVRIPYEAFRSRQRVSSVLEALSLASLIVAPLVVNHSSRGPGSAVYYAIGAGAVFGISGLAVGAGASGKLDEAIARYNDRLPDRR